MKILHITNMYYPSISGVGQVTWDIVSALNDNGNVQKVICFNSEKKNIIQNIDGVEVRRCKVNLTLFSQQLSLSYPGTLRRVMKTFNPDVVFVNYPNPFLIHFLLKYRNKPFRLFTFWHSDIVRQSLLSKFFKPMIKRMIERSEKVLYSTKIYLENSNYREYAKDKAEVLNLKINEDVRNLTEKQAFTVQDIRKKYEGKILCVSVARHVEYKGIKYLIEASKYLDDRYRFFLFGNGKLTEKLRKMAEGDPKIEFITGVSEDLKKCYLNACDIYCFPSISKNEAFGLALGEAMLCGKPAVTFHIKGSGVNELCRAGRECVECENPLENEVCTFTFADGLLKLSDPVLRGRLGEAARNRIETCFNGELFKERVNRLLKERV